MRGIVAAASALAAAVLAAPAAGAGSGWPPLRTAGPFLVETVYEKTRGHWGTAWRTLYPAHKRVAPRRMYVRCERSTQFPAPLQHVRVLGAERGLVRVAGSTRGVPGVAVTVEVTLGWTDPREPIVFTHTFHLVPDHGRWTWVLSPTQYRDYGKDACLFRPAV
jgi:hypothetical protein